MGVWGRGKTVVYIYGAGSGVDLQHFFIFFLGGGGGVPSTGLNAVQ